MTLCERVYKPDEIGELLDDSRQLFREKCYGKYNPDLQCKTEYYNFPVAFDIETTNYEKVNEYNETEKFAFMYVWQMSIAGRVIMGRTWTEFIDTLNAIRKRLLLDETHVLVIYVHNLGFEFSFIHKYLNVKRVFAITSRSPITVETRDGFEFRCSAKLSGLPLEAVAENLTQHDIRKLKGNLNYNLVRHSETPLTHEEIAYCVNDVQILIAYIAEEMDKNDGKIAQIPMTITGYARRHCREMCLNPPLPDGKQARKGQITNKEYKRLMKRLTVSPEEYDMLKRAFQGGFTHANAIYSGDINKNVSSYDFTSSYPAIMVMETFPMSKGEFIQINTLDELRENMKYYHCIFDIVFYGLERRGDVYDTYLSLPRARYHIGGKKFMVDNNKIVKCEKCAYTITEIDFQIIERCYKWESIAIGQCVRYRRDYLPTELVKAILELYRLKTELKNAWKRETPEKAILIKEMYMLYKGLLNSVYGMTVTDILRDIFDYDPDLKEWVEVRKPDKIKAIEDENKRKRRFLFYPWGVYTTAYARRNLWSGILELGIDYIYSDTDSLKLFNRHKHLRYFAEYNRNVDVKIENAAKYHGIPIEDFSPRTINGVKKTIGYWDYEGDFVKFKTLGSKRYLVCEYDEENESFRYELTCSGLNKKLVTPFLLFHKFRDETGKLRHSDIWHNFAEGLHVPGEITGKLIHTYLDEEFSGDVIDYLGNRGHFSEKSGTHLGPCPYDLTIEDDYQTTIEYLIELTRMP